MPRVARVVVPGLPHHVTQRGNNRQDVFFTDDDRRLYLKLVREESERFGLAIRGYCLMTNHVHLVAVPEHDWSLAKALGAAHLKYSQYINRLHGRSGHLWQNRFYSCPLDPEHELIAVRYAERNPVRTRPAIVRLAWRYRWSSAAAHCGEADDSGLLDVRLWKSRFSVKQWLKIVQQHEDEDESAILLLRRNTQNGRPLGDDRFIAKLEAKLNRRLRQPKMGRPPATAGKRRPARKARR